MKKKIQKKQNNFLSLSDKKKFDDKLQKRTEMIFTVDFNKKMNQDFCNLTKKELDECSQLLKEIWEIIGKKPTKTQQRMIVLHAIMNQIAVLSWAIIEERKT